MAPGGDCGDTGGTGLRSSETRPSVQPPGQGFPSRASQPFLRVARPGGLLLRAQEGGS